MDPAGICTASEEKAVCRSLLNRLEGELAGFFTPAAPFTFMEVCGTHTVAIFRSGLATLLPPAIRHISGPGCPVCVTHDQEVSTLINLSLRPEVLLATFGDMLRIPDPRGRSLKWARSQGARIELIYSPLQALDLARAHPENLVVFPAAGFETTAPAVAAVILKAREEKIPNFAIFSLHKRVAPALESLCSEENAIHGFLLPGHVCAITGCAPFSFLPSRFGKAAVVGGFEAADILRALVALVSRHRRNSPGVGNEYGRVVKEEGNPRAMQIMWQVFEPGDALWRGLGSVQRSGLQLREEYREFDALTRLDMTPETEEQNRRCRCGAVLKGKLRPRDCPLFKKECTPAHPAGPCMVSTEGSCAAEYAYLV